MVENPRNHRRDWSPDHRELVGYMYKEGYTINEIAKRVDRTEKAIIAQLNRQGFSGVGSRPNNTIKTKVNNTIQTKVNNTIKTKVNNTIHTRLCTKCGRDLPISSFHIDKRRGNPRSWCKECHNQYSLELYHRNKGIKNETGIVKSRMVPDKRKSFLARLKEMFQ